MIERRAVVARQAGRRRLRIVVATLGVAALGAGLFGLAHSPLISVRTVRVTGAVHTTRAEILAASGLGRDPPLVDVNTLADAHAIERLPWVRTTSVSVSFPSSVRVVVTERRVVAAARRGAASVALLDVTGRVLADASRPPAGIVSLVGLVDLPAPGGSVRGAGGAARRGGGAARGPGEPGHGAQLASRARDRRRPSRRAAGDPRLDRGSPREIRRFGDGACRGFSAKHCHNRPAGTV